MIRTHRQGQLQGHVDALPHQFGSGNAPRHDGTDPHPQQQGERERDGEPVEERGADPYEVAVHSFEDHRIDRPNQHDEGVHRQHQIVEQQRTLATHERVHPGWLGDQGRPESEQRERSDQHHCQKSEEHRTDRRLRERMN